MRHAFPVINTASNAGSDGRIQVYIGCSHPIHSSRREVTWFGSGTSPPLGRPGGKPPKPPDVWVRCLPARPTLYGLVRAYHGRVLVLVVSDRLACPPLARAVDGPHSLGRSWGSQGPPA
ncbi:hypothetical protein PCASD_02944 [Puccinia coronata f. sp. avenae]|uniref:Uncharacterized protein n=1 Tax=Puccinia coronata f. sp. avenae TaxID=200324 RepID=A0A2N5VE89_9BASI|nr:hypothetical protein PCASD_02944 [Puccinia coronata f. sp. avenae]